ncbi:MAG: class II histone deacetylase [Candidatus Dormibacteraceae bacterium]
MRTGYVWPEQFVGHNSEKFSPYALPGSLFVESYSNFESLESKIRLAHLVEASGLLKHLDPLTAQEAEDEDLLRVHKRLYIESIRAQSGRPEGGDAGDGHTRFAHGGFEIARLAAGGAITATAAVLEGRVQNAYALVHPPGHHALLHQGLGFCIFANLAIAAEWARTHYEIRRIAVVDWDVHHGNGTQAIYEQDPDTLTISLHQDRLFPMNSGLMNERGSGRGHGYAINIPLPAGSGNDAYIATIERVVAPALRVFQPELILVASGFDACLHDPLGRQMLTVSGFRALAQHLRELANELTGGRLVLIHEGGYSPHYVPYCGLAVMEALSGMETDTQDPRLEFAGHHAQLLQPWQEEVIDQAAQLATELAQHREARNL